MGESLAQPTGATGSPSAVLSKSDAEYAGDQQQRASRLWNQRCLTEHPRIELIGLVAKGEFITRVVSAGDKRELDVPAGLLDRSRPCPGQVADLPKRELPGRITAG